MKKAVRGAEELEAVDARLEELGRKMDRLRVLYENFFSGVERIPPNVPRRELNRLILELQQVQIGNATMRFRFQTLLQRWVLLTTYWNRTMREIEAGTYRRDMNKAHRHLAAKGGVISESEALQLGIPATRVKSFVARQNKLVDRRNEAAAASRGGPEAPGTPGAAAPGAPAARVPGGGDSAAPEALPGLSQGALEDFYRKYVDAHTRAAGVAPKASLDQMRAKLERDLPRILAEQGCDRVELDVAVDGGKVRLRARPVR